MIVGERLWFVPQLSEEETCAILSALRVFELSELSERDRLVVSSLVGRFMSAVGEARGEVDGCG